MYGSRSGSPDMVTVSFMSLSAPKPPPITVKKNTTYGEVFNMFFETAIGKGFKKNGGKFLVKSKIVNTIEQLEERITKNVSVFISKMNPVIDQISPLVDAYNNKTPWPPARNYFDVDPISLKTVGKMNTGETRENSIRGTTNEAKNMIITSLGPTTAKRTAYNKQSLLNWFESSSNRGLPYTLPDNRHPVTPAEVRKIRESRGNFEVIDIGTRRVSPVRRASPVRDVDYYIDLINQRIDRGHMNDLPQARILEMARDMVAADVAARASRVSPPASARSATSNVRERDNNRYANMYREELARGFSPDTARERARTRLVEDRVARVSPPASGRSSISATPSPLSSASRSSNRNLPNGSPRTNSGRSSVSTASPSVSPRSRARAAAILEARSRASALQRSARRSN